MSLIQKLRQLFLIHILVLLCLAEYIIMTKWFISWILYHHSPYMYVEMQETGFKLKKNYIEGPLDPLFCVPPLLKLKLHPRCTICLTHQYCLHALCEFTSLITLNMPINRKKTQMCAYCTLKYLQRSPCRRKDNIVSPSLQMMCAVIRGTWCNIDYLTLQTCCHDQSGSNVLNSSRILKSSQKYFRS